MPRLFWLSILPALLTPAVAFAENPPVAHAPGSPGKVSYYKQIRPIFQAQCQGCHQPAKAKGEYVMTAFDRLLAGGESGEKAVVPHHPEASQLVAQITPKDGKAKMPEGKKPLDPSEIELIRRWVAEGAIDDTPANAVERYSMDHPPVYTRPPVIASLDYSPDGQYLAVAGFHEVLLCAADSGQLVARLVGLSERIQSVKFSPDGTQLAVTGGLPARMGEVQVWDVAKRTLKLSVPVTYDTVYGVSWSPDGSKIAFGCADNTVRAIDAKSGEQVLYQGSHNDWVLNTVFSKDGSHLVSIGRDRTAKLIEVATQRFVDNITSITPGALKGGLQTVARHPERDEVVVGGADGVAKVYRLFRVTARVIGDDSNLIREMPPMRGRIFGVAVSRDGKRIAAGASDGNSGEVHVYGYEFDTKMPDNIRAIQSKVSSSRNAQEREALEKYYHDGVKLIARTDLPRGVYAVAFRPDGQQVAAAGADGTVRLINATTGHVDKEFAPAPIADVPPPPMGAESAAASAAAAKADDVPAEKLPAGATLTKLEVQPAKVQIAGKFDTVQLVVTGRLASGDAIDVTRMVEMGLSADIADVSRGGLVRARADGSATLHLSLAGQSVDVPVSVAGVRGERPSDYVRDVMPVLSRLGCNAGTCHGSKEGKNGFKLSLRGYDPEYDVAAFTDEVASRRVNIASPDDSLMLMKATGAVPHVGGQLFKPGEPNYEIIRRWIAGGARLNLESPRVKKIEITPANPILQRPNERQQMRVVATYADGRSRDVTPLAFIESGNTEIATAGKGGLMTALRRGEAPVLARFEGAYTATTLTVMGDRDGFAWKQPPAFNRIDELTAAKWKRLKIQPSELCSDTEFIRRAYLDLTGLPPSADDVRAFLADSRHSCTKRDELIDKLVGSKEYVEYWTNKWADLLEVNRKFLGAEGAAAYRKWVREQVAKNTPYDQFVREILTASGSNREHPAASYWKIQREPAAAMENTTHLFLGVRFNCNKCHDHPFERWTQDQYYQTAAYFARFALKTDPASNGRNIGGTAVEGAKPLYEVVTDVPAGEMLHDRTHKPAAPQFPFACKYQAAEDASRRQQLAAWLTSPDNPYFARSYVNRVWGYVFGVGIIEPIDDIRAGNPPSNPELLDYLTREFIDSGFNVQELMRLICKSRTYQLAVATNKWNADDKHNYSHATAKRLPAEVIYDALQKTTGAVSKVPGLPPGTRAAEFPDSGVELPSGFLTTLGRPPRESACECERTTGLQLGPVMALINGQTVAEAIADPNNAIAKLVSQEADDTKLVRELFLRILNRPANDAEVNASLETFRQLDADHQKLVKELGEREVWWKPIQAKKEQERGQAIAQAKTELAAYEKELAPRLAEAEKQRQERIAKASEAFKQYEATLPDKLAAWEKTQKAGVDWVRLNPRTLEAPRGTRLVKQDDLSILATGRSGNGNYTVTASTDLRGITAVRLEVLADERLPGGGPGRAKNGNFVLNQIELKVAPKSDPGKAQKAFFARGKADFAQDNYPIKSAIDGSTNGGKGWALAPHIGVTHWAVLELKEPIDFDGGAILTFTLSQQFGLPDHLIGRFRLSVAAAKGSVPLGLAEDLQTIVDTPAAARDAKQQAALMKYYRTTDKEFLKKQQALAEAQKPLPPDPRLLELKAALAEAEKPVAIDPKLLQLRQDVAASTQQMANKRLTAAQDVAWALINSPAFLFNH